MGQALQSAPAGHRAAFHYERRRPEETTLYQVVQEQLETFLAQVEAKTGAGLPEFIKAEFEAYLECGILAHGFLRLRCAGCAHEKLVAFSCPPRGLPAGRKRRGFCPSCGARRMAESAAHLFDQVIPRGPVRQWVLSFPIPLRILFAAHPELLTPVSAAHRFSPACSSRNLAMTRWMIRSTGASNSGWAANRIRSGIGNDNTHCLTGTRGMT